MVLWSGRFSNDLNEKAWKMNASIDVDHRLAIQDIKNSLAWINALLRAGVLSKDEHLQIQKGLQKIKDEFIQGVFMFGEKDEDIHTAIERRLGELIGSVSGKLHTGRSRNDQVATSFRLWLLENIPAVESSIKQLQSTLLGRAESELGVIMPGYTHFQRAQPILLSHWWLSHFWPLQRDRQRFIKLIENLASMPLGSGALAGTTYAIDRHLLALELGFHNPCANSIDAVSDRDFVAEFLFTAALTGVHLSRLAEAVILFSTTEYGFFTIPDEFATGSSLMPQKKNPDLFELARGKSGALIGCLTGFLSTLKSLPSAYDKDLQEDKQPVLYAFDTLGMTIPVFSEALMTLLIHPEKMLNACDAAMYTTDLVDYLVKKGLSFREAHTLVGNAVKMGEKIKKPLDQISLVQFKTLSDLFAADLYDIFDPQKSISKRQEFGGTARNAVQDQVRLAQDAIGN